MQSGPYKSKILMKKNINFSQTQFSTGIKLFWDCSLNSLAKAYEIEN